MRPFVILIAVFAVLLCAAFASACPPVVISSGYNAVQVQAGCFAPAVAVQAYAAPIVAVQAHPVIVSSHAAVVQVNVAPRVRVRRGLFGASVIRVR